MIDKSSKNSSYGGKKFFLDRNINPFVAIIIVLIAFELPFFIYTYGFKWSVPSYLTILVPIGFIFFLIIVIIRLIINNRFLKFFKK
jgi:hypothetical protein